MMGNILEYKGYHTKIEFDKDDLALRGKIEGISDYVDFESGSISEVEMEFHKAVDDYLEFCAEVGKTPEKEYRGTFNVRIDPSLHRKLAYIAYAKNVSLNTSVEKAISDYVVREADLLDEYNSDK